MTTTTTDAATSWLRGALDEIERSEHGKRTLSPLSRATCPTCGSAAESWTLRCRDEYDLPCGDLVSVSAFWDHNGEATPDRGVLARVEAERAVLAMTMPEGYVGSEVDGWFTAHSYVVALLAHGHRHDVPGYDPAWTPVEPS